MPFRQAYFEALKATVTSIAFTGITLALRVATWDISSMKFKADMGPLLVLLFA